MHEKIIRTRIRSNHSKSNIFIIQNITLKHMYFMYLINPKFTWAGGPARQPYARVDFILQSGIYEFGYW